MYRTPLSFPLKGLGGNDRLVLAGRADFYIVLYYRRRDGTEAVPYNYIYSTLCLFPSARISTLATPQSALRLTAPLRGAPLRGKDLRLAQLGSASRQKFGAGAVAAPRPLGAPLRGAGAKRLRGRRTWTITNIKKTASNIYLTVGAAVANPLQKQTREALQLPVCSFIYFIEKNASLPRYSAESNSSSSMRSS